MRPRALSAAVLAVVLIALSAGPAGAEGELDDARRQANAVAAELAESQSRLAQLEDEIAALEDQAAAGASRRAALEHTVRVLAVDRFMHSAPPAVPIFEEDLNAAVRADALAGFVAADSSDALDEYRRAGQDVEAAEQALEAVRAEAAQAVATFQKRAAAANSELAALERLDAERRAREEADRARQEAVSRTAAPARQARAGSDPTTTSRRRPAASPSRAAPAPRLAEAVGRAVPAVASGSWTCPVQGARAFSNDWGQPRSGGRSHQGNDILSPRGTPVVASVSGTVRPHQSSLGGISYYLTGNDGNTYFGTHLDSLSGASGSVSQGEVLGYVGNSGNAAGGPTHLHFEIHPGGGAAVNPYPTLSQYC